MVANDKLRGRNYSAGCLIAFRRKNAFRLLNEHAQVTPPDPAERVVPLLFGAASGGSCAFEYRSLTVAARDQVLCYQQSN